MTDFLHQTEIENRKQNESNELLDNQSMILEFTPLAQKIDQFDQQSLGMKLFLGILLLIMETLGNYLLFCMVWYEKFGMDSKKRTITNQLLSRMILALIIFNISFMPLQFVGFWIIDEYVYLIAEFGIYRILMHIMLTLAEMVIFKIIYMFKFSIIAALDEYFLTSFVTLCNAMINFVFSIIRITLGENKKTEVYFNSFAKPTDVLERVPWP